MSGSHVGISVENLVFKWWVLVQSVDRGNRYLTLKVCTSNKRLNNEIAISNHLKNSGLEHPGKPFVRVVVLDSFDVTGPSGNSHQCLLYEPLAMSFKQFLGLLPEHKFPEDLLQSMQLVLIGLEYLHQPKVVHIGKLVIQNLQVLRTHLSMRICSHKMTGIPADISANNILQGISDGAALSEIEEGEMNQPIARKVLCERTIYNSRPMPANAGLPVLN